MRHLWLPFYLSLLVVLTHGLEIGVNYGLLGNNLPPPKEVVAMLKQYQIGSVRLFEPNHDVLNVLANSGIKVTVGVANQELAQMASNQGAADAWVASHIMPYANSITFEYITAGNEVIPGDLGNYVASAMRSLYNAVIRSGLNIKVSTVVPGHVLDKSDPPSASVFHPDSKAAMVAVIKFLSETGSSLLANTYPYYPYSLYSQNIRLDFALSNATGPVVTDGNLQYTNLLDAMIDTFYWAMEKEGVNNVPVVIGESGWPTAGNGQFTSVDLASTYNRNFKNKILSGSGTPKLPEVRVHGFIFALFNENLKPSGTEQNWGIFYPDKTPVYSLF